MRCGRELQNGAADDVVQPPIAQCQAIDAGHGFQIFAASLPPETADLVDIGEVRPNVERDCDVSELAPVVLNLDFLVKRTLPEELPYREMQSPQRKVDNTITAEIGIGQRDRQLVVVVPDSRAQEERPAAVQVKDQAGEKPRPVMVDALFAGVAGYNIAVLIKQGEGVAMLQHSYALISEARVRKDVVRILPGSSRLLLGFADHALKPATQRGPERVSTISPRLRLSWISPS